MAKKLSAGVIVVGYTGSYLVGRATGTKHWDIFKGMVDPGEAHIDAALRELREETGLILIESELEPLGQHSYTKDKDLVLWKYTTKPDEEFHSLRCSSTFVDRFGRTQPEIDSYTYITKDMLKDYLAKSMYNLFVKLNLA